MTPDSTVRDAILDAIEAALAGLADEIEVEPIGDATEATALFIFDNGHRTLETDPFQTRYELDLTVEGYVVGTVPDDTSADQSRDVRRAAVTRRNALHAAAVRAIMADEELALAVELVDDGDCRMTTARLDRDRRLGFAQDFVVQFSTRRGDPALPA